MNIKWNWGTGIFIAIVLMMSFVGLLVYKSFDYKINKVSEDYYERGLNHTEQMNRVENSKAYADEFFIDYSDVCAVQFPKYFTGKELNGEILFFRPSDYSQDKKFKIELDSNAQQVISLEYFIKGKYIVKVTFDTEGEPYYFESDIMFN